MEEHLDPHRISQLSRRKLRCVSCDERRDNHNLRRLVLTQNLLLSTKNKSNTSLASTSSSSSSSSSQSFVDTESQLGGLQHTEGSISPRDRNHHEDYGFGFVFPDNSSWASTSTSNEPDNFPDVVLDESEWLDAVLSDLVDDSVEDDDDDDNDLPATPYYPPRYQPASHIYFPSLRDAPTPSTTTETKSYDHYDPHACTPESDSGPQLGPLFPPITCTCGYDGLPYFDTEDSSDSDDSRSEPSTPLSASLRRTTDNRGDSDEKDDQRHLLEKNLSLFEFDDERCSYIRQPPSDFFSCHYSRTYGF
ncbi:uncharacterized protein EI90DRAFT_3050476 [Cantharellus anzutake]|uniref:uncharacterized protein n=1 Tax=Cantharellus anzutake TaxID=1750568 RepID=UPI0019087435|nr:uncharacterized protein EI90DRAFT_3050476 [Cantharellus anzutake]KAF8333970.1 hypothetical protein EI90DRAFT_3050476 [Cantharellus anzutake]